MKKCIAIIMIAAIALGMSMISLTVEGEEITQDSQQSGETKINYNIGVSYTVTIPASVTFTDTEKSVERGLLAKDVFINEGSSLKVNISSQNDFQMKNSDAYIDYYIMMNNATVLEENNSTLLIVNAGEGSAWAILEFITKLDKKNAYYAGNYTDTLTFTVSVD